MHEALRPADLDFELVDEFLSLLVQLFIVDDAALGEFRQTVRLDARVFRNAQLSHRGKAVAILGDKRQPVGDALAHRCFRDILLLEGDRPAGSGAQAGQRLHQLLLSVAGNTSNAQNFARIQAKAELPHRLELFVI